MGVKGQVHTVTTVLLLVVVTSLVASYYFFAQTLFQERTSRLSATIKKYHDLAAQYLRISTATAHLVGNVAEFSVRVVNQGDAAVIPYKSVTIYVYKGTDLIWSGKSTCPAQITPAKPCNLTFSVISSELSNRRDFSEVSIQVYVNDVPLSSGVDFLGRLPGESLFITCDSCSECSTAISSAPPGSLVLVKPNSPSPNCLDISDAHGVTVYCTGIVSGDGTGDGIRIVDSSDIVVKNCEITNFSRGVYIENSQGISFSNVYSHDNGQDLYVPAGSVQDICTFGSMDFTATSGPILLVNSPDVDLPVLSASAVWVVSPASGYIHSESPGASVSLSRVSPGIAICNTSSTVKLTDFSVTNADLGIAIYRATDPRLESIDVSANVQGIYAVDVVGGYLSSVTIESPGTDVFLNPTSLVWDYGVVFR